MYEQTPFEKKENVDEFVAWLRNAFAGAVADYIEQWWQLRREIDSDWVKQSLSSKEKIAQLFMFWLSWTEISTIERQFLKENKPWGLIIMWWNVSDQLKLLTNDIQSTNVKIPLFIWIDQEGWPVKRINENLSGQFDVAFENICSTYTDRAELLQEQWINTNFWIIADVTSNKNAFIHERTFPTKASESVAQAVACTEKTLSTIKHFPWHWMVQWDSHTGIQKTTLSCDAWKANHLPPFLSGIKNDVDLVMLGHILLPCVDANNPATLSESHVAYIRNTWYDGLLITDDMDMIATNYTWKDALEKALLAWNDIILYVDDTEIISSHAFFAAL